MSNKLLGFMKVSILITFFLVFSISCSAPEPKGSVSEAEEIQVSGKIVGSDGRPMPASLVSVEGGEISGRLISTADENGRYQFSLPGPGAYSMYGIGLHHETLDAPLIIEDSEYHEIKLDLQLSGIDIMFDPDSVFAKLKNNDEKILLTRSPDGSYRNNIGAIAAEAEYQILLQDPRWGRPNFPIPEFRIAGAIQNGVSVDTTGKFWDSGSEFFSITPVDEGTASVLFKPAELPRVLDLAIVTSTPSYIGEVSSIFVDVEKKERDIGMASRSQDGYLEVVKDAQDAIKSQIDREDNPLIRSWLLMRYFDELHPTKSDRSLAELFIETVPPDSKYWIYEAMSSVGASNNLVYVSQTLQDSVAILKYLKEMEASNEDPNLGAQIGEFGMRMADQVNNEAERSYYYDLLISNYPESRQAINAQRHFSPNRVIQVGKPLPDYYFFDLEDKEQIYNPEFFGGKVHLIDFWGTWCGPCIKEIPFHQEQYKKHKDKGFTILSAAFMDTYDSVTAFKDEKYAMPWQHSLVDAGRDSEIRDLFEIVGFPRTILINESGIVVAQNDELKGAKLGELLDKHYGF